MSSTGREVHPESETSLRLLLRARSGDQKALDRLYSRYLVPLQRWSRGRLPAWARDLMDTDDVVQETLVRSLRNVEAFEPRRTGAFQAYLRQCVLNRIRDEIRRLRRNPAASGEEADAVAPQPSPLEEAIGRQTLERYEAALARASTDDREAIIARVELGFPYEEVAEALGKPSPDAARMAVSRALLRLAREMTRDV